MRYSVQSILAAVSSSSSSGGNQRRKRRRDVSALWVFHGPKFFDLSEVNLENKKGFEGVDLHPDNCPDLKTFMNVQFGHGK